MADEKNNISDEKIPESNAAKRLKGLGIDPTAATETIEVAPVGFWENFWYHHKWKTLIISFSVIVLLICTLQMCTQNAYDIYIMYAGPGYMTPNETRSAQDTFKQLIPDHDGDGSRSVMLSIINYMNQEQIEEKRAQAEEEGVDLYIDLNGNAAALERFEMEVIAGESVIYLLDPALYESVKAAGGLLPLNEVLDTVPAGAVDDYGIRFAETAFYDTISSLQYLPEDTILCIRKISTMSVFKGQEKSAEMHERHVALFQKIVSFGTAD